MIRVAWYSHKKVSAREMAAPAAFHQAAPPSASEEASQLWPILVKDSAAGNQEIGAR
jgi:hypothetical protein